MENKLDELQERVEQLERRLELADGTGTPGTDRFQIGHGRQYCQFRAASFGYFLRTKHRLLVPSSRHDHFQQ